MRLASAILPRSFMWLCLYVWLWYTVDPSWMAEEDSPFDDPSIRAATKGGAAPPPANAATPSGSKRNDPLAEERPSSLPVGASGWKWGGGWFPASPAPPDPVGSGGGSRATSDGALPKDWVQLRCANLAGVLFMMFTGFVDFVDGASLSQVGGPVVFSCTPTRTDFNSVPLPFKK